MSSIKTLLAAATLAFIAIGSLYYFSNEKSTFPIDSEGRKIRLGGIPWDFTNCGTENDPLIITSIVFSAMPERAAPPNDATLVSNYLTKIFLFTENQITILSQLDLTSQYLIQFIRTNNRLVLSWFTLN